MVASWRDREQRKREAAASRGPVSRGQRVRGGRPYFLFLRWILVFFSSLRCFFFAILLRRFLMTEPIRPPLLLAQRQTGTPSHSPGREAGHRPEIRIRANAYRPRSAQAYLVSHSGVTAWPPARRRRPGATARCGRRPGRPDWPKRDARRALAPWCRGGSGLSAVSSQRERSAGPYIGGPEVLVDRLFRNPERTADPDGFQFAGVDQPIDGHL